MADDKSLPFTEEYQEAIVGHCIENSQFFVKCAKKIKPQWFTRNMMIGAIYSQLCKAYEEDSAFITSPQELKNFDFFLEQTPADRDKYYVLIDKCILSARMISLVKIQKQLTAFLRVSLFKESIEGAAKRYKVDGLEDAYDWTAKKIVEIKEATFEDSKSFMSFENPEEWVNRQEARRSHAISTGSKALDGALGGGLFKKEACAIMAPSNVGKTTTLITIARHAVVCKSPTFFMMHEGDPEEIRLRILCALLGISSNTIFQWIKDKEKRELVRMGAYLIKENLVFSPYIKTGGMYVEDVVEIIKKANEERKVESGRGFDLIIDDYPKKLRSRHRTASKESLYRVEASEIYDNFNHLAVEIDAHCLVAVQTNRTGLKQNNNKIEADHLLGMEEIDEAYGIAQNIPNIITLNRSPKDRQLNIMRINVAKSRNGVTDIALNSRTNYNCYLTFGDKSMFLQGNELKHGFLASYMQETNEKFESDAVDGELTNQENKAPGDVGVRPMGGKIADE